MCLVDEVLRQCNDMNNHRVTVNESLLRSCHILSIESTHNNTPVQFKNTTSPSITFYPSPEISGVIHFFCSRVVEFDFPSQLLPSKSLTMRRKSQIP